MKPPVNRPPLSADLRKLVPIWGVAMATAVIVLFSMKELAKRQLLNAARDNQNACVFASVVENSAWLTLEKTLRELGDKTFPENKDVKTLGTLKGDPRLATAREEAMRALQLCPRTIDSYHTLAMIDWLEGNEGAAWRDLGWYHYKRRELKQATAAFDTTLAKSPQDAEAAAGAILARLDQNSITDAERLAKGRTEAIRGTSVGALVLGRLAFATKDYANAYDLLRKALEQDGSSVPAMHTLAGLGKTLGKPKEAAEFLANLGKTHPPHIDAYRIAATLYREMNDPVSEEAVLREASRNFRNSVHIAFDLALALYKNGKKLEARDEANRALEIDFDYYMNRVSASGVDPRK